MIIVYIVTNVISEIEERTSYIIIVNNYMMVPTVSEESTRRKSTRAKTVTKRFAGYLSQDFQDDIGGDLPALGKVLGNQPSSGPHPVTSQHSGNHSPSFRDIQQEQLVEQNRLQTPTLSDRIKKATLQAAKTQGKVLQGKGSSASYGGGLSSSKGLPKSRRVVSQPNPILNPRDHPKILNVKKPSSSQQSEEYLAIQRKTKEAMLLNKNLRLSSTSEGASSIEDQRLVHEPNVTIISDVVRNERNISGNITPSITSGGATATSDQRKNYNSGQRSVSDVKRISGTVRDEEIISGNLTPPLIST